ncbi:PIN domain-containing protein [Castellaniella hirudinis]|uniref:PIN domain-containing protein n=1 Tax=Castellaniella hirudinis TaxID=1144617 RepID=UPI0039C01870
MAALDTNVLVRWLVNDDARQSAAVLALLDTQCGQGQLLFVPITVVLETEWVLRSRYGFDRLSITAAFDALLCTAELEFQHEAALEQALWFFRRTGAPDFADCLHAALVGEAVQGPLLTFDKKAAKIDGVSLLA